MRGHTRAQAISTPSRASGPILPRCPETKIAPGTRPGAIPNSDTSCARGSAGSDRLEHPLVARQRSPGTDAPAFRGEGRAPATADAAANLDLEIGERDAAELRLPDGTKREDRVERRVAVHTYITPRLRAAVCAPANGGCDVSNRFRSTSFFKARVMPGEVAPVCDRIR